MAEHELWTASRVVSPHLRQVDISVPGIHCGGCVQRIESALGPLAGVEHVRVNLSTKRVCVRWPENATPPAVLQTLKGLGFDAHVLETADEENDPVSARLIRALAVSGFAAGNIMLLSVSVWFGAEPATRDIFHWVSAAIALPTLIYAGSVFYESAWKSLRHWQTNMDVPISIGITVAFGMSLYDTINHGAHAYFDASVTLLFFLLIGRALDHLMREKARNAVKGLASIAARGATVCLADGSREYLPVSSLQPGMTIVLAAGERVPVDARVTEGTSDIDNALVTGESLPVPVGPGADLRAGTLNLTGPLSMIATAAAKDSFLAEMVRLMEAAEAGRGPYRRIADRAASLYAPVVHSAALLSFIGWMIFNGDMHNALTIAVAVLIITCPCAIGLAVPMVQVVAARRLFENRIMLKDGSALERLTEVDTVVFDKTGTLTLGALRLCNVEAIRPEHLACAQAIAARSLHPCSKAISAAENPTNMALVSRFDEIVEMPGFGMEARSGAVTYRLGRAAWALADGGANAEGTVLARDGEWLATFDFEDSIRPNTETAIRQLESAGLAVEIISGDGFESVATLATRLGVDQFSADMLPGEKLARIRALAAAGHKVMMVGDGLNDTPALTAAHVSMAPATAADVGRNAADFVFLRDSLEAVPLAFSLSRGARKLIRQNFVLALVYNAVALPAAVFGHITPLVAALAMSGSSIAVVANALRLSRKASRRSLP
jgi:Cu2+-exporting ATPase